MSPAFSATVLAALAGAIASTAGAAVPTYTGFELKCRANFSGAYKLPNTTFFTNGTPSINEDGAVAIKLEIVSPELVQGVWFEGLGTNFVRYRAPDEGTLSDVTVNDSRQICINQFFTTPTAVIRCDGDSGAASIAVPPGGIFGALSFSSPEINNAGMFGFRAQLGIGGQAFISDNAGQQAKHVEEVGANLASPYSFLFTPSFNNNRQIAGKARRGGLNQVGETQPDEIRVWNADGSSVLIAEDRESNPASPFLRFDNSVGLNDNGWVAFTAGLNGGARGVFLSNGSTTIEIASTVVGATNRVSEVEFFKPVVNNNNLVAFRGRDVNGVQSIFVGDGTTLTKIVGRGDIVPSDLGPARVDQHDSSPVFGGSIGLNDRGDVAFNVGLTPPENNQIEWGSAVMVALAAAGAPADLNGDGVVGAADLAILLGSWGPCASPCPADLDGDGVVGAADLAALLGSWG